MKKKLTGAPLGCATKFVSAQWECGLIRIVYEVGGGPPLSYLLTEEYTRDVVVALSQLLARPDDPPIDDIEFEPEGTNIRVTLKLQGQTVGARRITPAVARKAKDYFDSHPPPGAVFRPARFRQEGR